MTWDFDVKTITTNYFQYYKIWLDEDMIYKPLVSKDEHIHGSCETIVSLQNMNVMDVEHLLNYRIGNCIAMKSCNDEKIIQGVMNRIIDDPHDLDSCIYQLFLQKRYFN